MQVSDPVRETAVWARVYSRPDSEIGLAAQLADWIVMCRRIAVSYYDLARMAPRHGPALRQLAQSCAGEGANLSALYIALTHRQPPKPAAISTLETEPGALIPTLYRQETDMAEQLMAACQDSCHRELLRRQADDQHRRAADLLELCKQYL